MSSAEELLQHSLAELNERYVQHEKPVPAGLLEALEAEKTALQQREAALTAADEADRAAGRRITCPTLVLWSARDDLEELHGDPLPIWARWTADLRGGGRIDSGHHMAEEAPEELAAALVPFLAS